MLDGYGRNVDYIRISVTDRCNLRCIYCMPQDSGISFAKEAELNDEELKRLCRVFASLGIKKIKITGGEPLLRKRIVELIKEIKSIEGIEYVSITTNGLYLSEIAKELKDAGIDGINISIDAMDRELFKKISGVDKYHKVLLGLKKAIEYGIPNIKINCVVIKDYNENQLASIAEIAKENHISIRFIEIMPMGFGKTFHIVSQDEIIEKLQKVYGEFKINKEKKGNGPAVYYSIEGFKGDIGFISAISHKFCKQCNRIRLSSLGFLKSCLQYDEGVELRKFLKSDISDETLKEAIENVIFKKPLSHSFNCECNSNNIELKIMAQIGG